MARLLRLHLASVGHPDARFSPLTLDFRGRDGAASNTVLWLRNGGGKSSLLNLFYSTFIPQKARFLGKKSDGRSRELTDYVQARDLACVVSEWDMSSGRDSVQEKRIIGQIMSWKDAVAAPHDESRLERCFFTFRTNETVNFDTLPIFGLSEHPVVSLTLFKDWLNWVKTEHRALEAESRMQKGEWVRVLAEVGFDEDLFKYQLVMNGREGGADELFRVKTTDDFIELFLEMAYPPQQANATAKTLEGVREKLRKLPQHQLEERFILELIGTLLPLENAAEELDDAAKKLDKQRQQNFLLHAAIKESLGLLATHEAAAKEEVRVIDNRLTELKRTRDALVEYRRNYEALAADLAVTEAESALAEAEMTRAQRETAHRVAVAAEALVKLRGQQERLTAFHKAREEMLVQQKPEMDALKAAGTGYHVSLGLAEAEAANLEQSAVESLRTAKALRADAESRLTTLAKESSKTQTEFKQVEQQLIRRNDRREVLRKDGLIEPQEKAAVAAQRLDEARKAKEQEAERLEQSSIEADQVAVERREAADKAAAAQREHEAKVKELAALVVRGEAEAKALQSNHCIIEVLSSDTVDLDFEPLAELLRQREADCLRRIVDTELDVADDRRAEKAIEADHLMPASRDVELALEHLRSRQILSAMPAYRFLSHNERQMTAAEERLRADPARYSGIMVNTEADMERIRALANAVPRLRHPVVVSLSGFTMGEIAIPDTIVLMPESPGAFNQAAASAAKDGIEQRLARSAEAIRILNERRQETAAVQKRLLDFRAEFGRGTLARMDMERRLAAEEAAAAKAKADHARKEAAAYHSRCQEHRAAANAIRKELPGLAAGIQRVQSYVQEFERNEDEWLGKRTELQNRLATLTHEEQAATREKSDAEKRIEEANTDVAARRGEVVALAKERAAILYRNDESSAEAGPLEQVKTRYNTLLLVFEQRYGGQQIDGEIREAERQRRELEQDYTRKRQQLDEDMVEHFAGEGDVAARLEAADRARVNALAEESDARRVLDKARTEVKPKAHKQGPGLPPDGPKISSAAEARAQQAMMGERIMQMDITREETQSQLSAKKEECSRLEKSLAAREPLLSVLADHIAEANGPMPSLPETDSELKTLADGAKSEAGSLGREHDAAAKQVDTHYDKLLAITRREEFHPLPLMVRDKLAGLPKPELLARCHEMKRGYEERQKVLRDEIESYTKDKDLVVRELHNVARTAYNLLGQAERASAMPETMQGWAGQSFLRIRSAEMPEQTACRERLGLLVERLVVEKVIPEGHRLAFAAVKEIAGPFKVTVLKPEPVLSPHRHDIVDFSSFSGGERLTAAILLYTALAQLRARSREGAVRAREAGLLILDNPFGAASLRAFVDLQQSVARQMGVQLIYATGVNDLGALEVFPRILRLRNAHLDRHTGNKLVTEELPTSGVRVAAANLRHE